MGCSCVTEMIFFIVHLIINLIWMEKRDGTITKCN